MPGFVVSCERLRLRRAPRTAHDTGTCFQLCSVHLQFRGPAASHNITRLTCRGTATGARGHSTGLPACLAPVLCKSAAVPAATCQQGRAAVHSFLSKMCGHGCAAF